MKSTLQIENLSIIKKNSDKNSNYNEVVIVKGLSATFESGKLNAIMGPNGCGKTTTLSSIFGLSDRSTRTSGKILLDGEERTPEKWYSETSIVEQPSYFPENETVEQALNFSLGLKNVRCKTNDKLSDHTDILDNLNLTKLFGHKISTLSGGEKQRIMIAIEIIADKKILILDEPTSDLDAHLALKLICFLKKLAIERSKMIILTIHQPSEQIVKQFDNILFMVDKCAAYNGPANQLDNFLKSKGICRPLDWTTSDFLFEAFYNNSSFAIISDQKENISKFLNEISKNAENIHDSMAASNKSSKYYIFKPCLGQITLLLRRFLRQTFCSKAFNIRILSMLVSLFMILFTDRDNLKIPTLDSIKRIPKFFTYMKDDGKIGSLLDDEMHKELVKAIEDSANDSTLFSCFSAIQTYLRNNTGLILVFGCSFFSILFASDVFNNIHMNEKEMLLGHYSPISFIIAALINEFVVYCYSGLLICLGLKLLGVTDHFYKLSFARIFFAHIFNSFTIMFISSLSFLIPVSVQMQILAKSLLLYLPYIFFTSFPLFLSIVKHHVSWLEIPARILLGIFDIIFPAMLMFAYISERIVFGSLSEFTDLIGKVANKETANLINSVYIGSLNTTSIYVVVLKQIYPECLGILLILFTSIIIIPILTFITFNLRFSPRVCLSP